MTDPICQLMEDVEGLSKRCYHLQKSNNDLYDYLSEDPQLREHIEENEKIIEKYHRKMNEILQLMKENGDQEKEIQWSPLTMDYRRMEEGEKAASDTKKRKFLEDQQHTEQTTSSEDRGVYL